MTTNYQKIKSTESRDNLQQLLEENCAQFMQRKPRTMDVFCPFCDASEKEPFFSINDFQYYHCVNCSSIYSTPRLTAEGLRDYYSFLAGKVDLHTVPHAHRQQRIEMVMRPRWEALKFQLEKLGVSFPVSSVLEVGPGVGYFTEVLQESNCAERYVLVEPDQSCLPSLKSLPNSLVFNGFIEECNVEEHGNNSILFINSVIEHPVELVPFFKALNGMLEDGGRVCLVDMNASGLDIELLRGDADNIVPNNILQVGTVEGVTRLVERCGFDVESAFPMGQMDADILYEYAQNQPQDDHLSSFARILKEEDVRKDFQAFLRKHMLTGYVGYVLKKVRNF